MQKTTILYWCIVKFYTFYVQNVGVTAEPPKTVFELIGGIKSPKSIDNKLWANGKKVTTHVTENAYYVNNWRNENDDTYTSNVPTESVPSTESSLQESSTFPCDKSSEKTTSSLREKRFAPETQNLETMPFGPKYNYQANLIDNENNYNYIDHPSPQQNFENANSRFREASSDNTPSCSQKSEIEMKLEKQNIEEINTEIQKLNELVELLRDQQHILNLLDAKMLNSNNNITKRFDAKDLLKVLERVNDSKASNSKQSSTKAPLENPETRTFKTNDEKQTTQEELEKIKLNLRNTVTVLNNTREMLSLERLKDTILETELNEQRTRLQQLENKIDLIHSTNQTEDNETVGTVLSRSPKTNIDNEKIFSGEHSNKQARVSDASSESKLLLKLLNLDKKPSGENLETDIKNLMAELEKKKKEDDAVQKERLILQRILESQSQKPDLTTDLAKRLSQALIRNMNKVDVQSRDDDLNLIELKALQNAITSINPEKEVNSNILGGNTEQQQFQAMLTQLLNEDSLGNQPSKISFNPESATNALKMLALKKQISPVSSNAAGFFNEDCYNRLGPQLSEELPINSQIKIGHNFGYSNNLNANTGGGSLGGHGSFSNRYYPFPYSFESALTNNRPSNAGYPARILNYPFGYRNFASNFGIHGPITPIIDTPRGQPSRIPQEFVYNTRNLLTNNEASIPNSGPQDSEGNKFFLGPHQQDTNVPTEQVNPYSYSNVDRPNFDQSAMDTPQPLFIPEQYKQQKLEELQRQISALQDVISNLNRPEYASTPNDKAIIANLEQKINILKEVINGMNWKPVNYINTAATQSPPGPLAPPRVVQQTPQNYPDNPSAPPPLKSPQYNNSNLKRKRRSAEESEVTEKRLTDLLQNFYTKYIDENSTSSNPNSNLRRSMYNGINSKLDDLKKQLGSQFRSNNGDRFKTLPIDVGAPQTRKANSGFTNYLQFLPSPLSSTSYQHDNVPFFQSSPVHEEKFNLVKSKKDELFNSIVGKILDKIIGVIPLVSEKLFGFGFSEIANSYGDSYSEIQNLLKNLGILGYFPLLIVKIVEGIGTFIKILKKNVFFKKFLVPMLVLGVVLGAVLFLICWFESENDEEDYGSNSYEIDKYDRKYKNYIGGNIYNEFPNQNYQRSSHNMPVYRSYLDNGQNWNWNAYR